MKRVTRRLHWTGPETATIRSSSNGHVRYQLAITAGGGVTCTCPACSRFGRTCRHIQQLAKGFMRKNGVAR